MNYFFEQDTFYDNYTRDDGYTKPYSKGFEEELNGILSTHDFSGIGFDNGLEKSDYYQSYQSDFNCKVHRENSEDYENKSAEIVQIESAKSPKVISEGDESDHEDENVPKIPTDNGFKPKSKTSKKDSKKEDPKKNAPGLHRDRTLKCCKDLMKTKDSTFESLKSAYDKFETTSKTRFAFVMKILEANREHFSEFKSFIEYMKKRFQDDWKDNKTWAKLNSFCKIKEFTNAGKLFKQIMYSIIMKKDNNELDIWMNKFRGNTNTKEYLTSEQYLIDFDFHVNNQ